MLTLTVTAMGVPVRFEVLGERSGAVMHALRHAWSRCVGLPVSPRFAGADPHAVRVQLLRVDEHEINASLVQTAALGGTPAAFAAPSHLARHRLDGLLVAVSKEVTMIGLAANRGELLLLHAAALVAPGGQAVVLVAGSGTGKTTLAALLGHQWGYLSDETAAIDADGRIVPYPKPLSVSRLHMNLKLETSPDDLALAAPPDESSVGGLILLERVASGQAVLDPVPTPQAVVALAGQSSGLVDMDRPLRRLAMLWDSLNVTGKLKYTESMQAMQVLHHLFGQAPVQPE